MRLSHGPVFILACCAAGAIGALAFSGAAIAQIPGTNGSILFAGTKDGKQQVFRTRPDEHRFAGELTLPDTQVVDSAPVLAPNLKKFAFERTTAAGVRAIYVTRANLQRTPMKIADGYAPAFSPDGSKIAFTTERDGNAEIYLVNADGTGDPVNLTEDPAADTSATFSPDGSRIAFESNRNGNAEIYLMRADGTRAVDVTDSPGRDDHPAFSSDGSQLAFVSDRGGDRDIYVTNADGSGSPVNVTNDAASDDLPTFSPNGSRIAFVSDRSGNGDIYTVNANGTASTRLTTNREPDTFPSFSPDGESLLYTGGADARVHILTPGRGLDVEIGSDGGSARGAAVWESISRAPTCHGPLRREGSLRTPFETLMQAQISCVDPDGDPFRVRLLGKPRHGTATLRAHGALTYTPAAGFSGTDIVRFSVTDRRGATRGTTRRRTADVDSEQLYLVIDVAKRRCKPACPLR